MKRLLCYIIGTGLGSGYVPAAPGTAGSAAGLIIAWFFFSGNAVVIGPAIVVASVLGAYAAGFIARDRQDGDPSLVVIDEVAGMWVTLLFVPPTPLNYLLAFGLFRLFDITKPFPIRHLEQMHGGAGIMLDDLGAGIYALLSMQILLQLLPL